MSEANRVLIHWDENGEVSWSACGDVDVVCVDERSPADRVYFYPHRDPEEIIAAIINGDAPISVLNKGNRQ